MSAVEGADGCPDQASIHRRHLLGAGLLAAGLLSAERLWAQQSSPVVPLVIKNVTGLYSVKVAALVAPDTLAELAGHVANWPGAIAAGGGRYSMGGQTAVADGLHIDMRGMNRLVWIRPQEMTVRVQAGMRWRDLQDHLDVHGLSVRTMQSYSNFTVGGAVGVNAHGRYVGHGPISGSVRALQIVLASGEVIEASRDQNAELFGAAIGGYGGIGIVAEVELQLDRNDRMERQVAHVELADYPGFFRKRVLQQEGAIMHNADLLPPLFDRAVAVTWSRTDKPVTVVERLVARRRSYALDRAVIWAMTELPAGADLQVKVVRPALLKGNPVVWRNHEASLDVASLEPASRETATYVLQEYFVPVAQFLPFAHRLMELVRTNAAQVVNISVRHSPADADALMTWAREEVFCFVLYYKQGVTDADLRAVGEWTRRLIDAALEFGGTYYLPYQLHATQAQFDSAYPAAGEFRRIKRRVDPRGKMTNEMWRRYL